jgi:hypothetical protein
MTTTIPTAAGLGLADTTRTEEYTIGCLSVPDRGGDTRVMWDSRNEEEVDAARKQFRDLTRAGYLAYKAEGKEGMRGEQIREFDPRAERIILVKPLAGG